MRTLWFVSALLAGTPALAQPAKTPSPPAAAAVAPELIKARAALSAKRWAAAEAALRPLVAAQPDHGVAHATLAHALMLQGKARYAESLEHYMTAAKLLPDSAEVHYGRGAVFLLMGQPREAKKEHRWLAARAHPLAGWLMYVIEDQRIPNALQGIIGVEAPR